MARSLGAPVTDPGGKRENGQIVSFYKSWIRYRLEIQQLPVKQLGIPFISKFLLEAKSDLISLAGNNIFLDPPNLFLILFRAKIETANKRQRSKHFTFFDFSGSRVHAKLQ